MTAQTALVTGAGIGRAIAQRLAHDGATVWCADLNRDSAEATAALIRDANGKADFAGVDIAEREQVKSLVEEITENAELDILVNNAGIGMVHRFLDIDPADLERSLRVNVMGTFHCAQLAARHMARRGAGRIINIASTSGERAGWYRTAYGTSKAAVIQLTRQMAVELAGNGVTVNAVSPGPIATDMTRDMHTPGTTAAYEHAVPMSRYGRPEEIAAAVAFLASDEASYITGHVLNVEGGFIAAGVASTISRASGERLNRPPVSSPRQPVRLRW